MHFLIFLGFPFLTLCFLSAVLAVLGLCCNAGFSLVLGSGGYPPAAVPGVLTAVAPVAEHGLQGAWASVAVARQPSCFVGACGIFPDQGSNSHLLHWQADSLPLNHQGSLTHWYLKSVLFKFHIPVNFSNFLLLIDFQFYSIVVGEKLCMISMLLNLLRSKVLCLKEKKSVLVFVVLLKKMIKQNEGPCLLLGPRLVSAVIKKTMRECIYYRKPSWMLNLCLTTLFIAFSIKPQPIYENYISWVIKLKIADLLFIFELF